MGFSSASAIEFYKDRIYIIGDDARYLLIADKQYNVIDTVTLFPGESLRIPKKEKADLEASAIHEYNGKAYLIVAGSGSTAEREDFFVFSLDDLHSYKKISQRSFFQSMKENGFPIINIEGLAVVNDQLVFANRANLSQPDNCFYICSPGFLYGENHEKGDTSILALPSDDGFLKGVSGMCYDAAHDLLLFTASVELTANAFDDGAIGNSYLGYISGFAGKMRSPTIKPDTLINLSALYKEFANEKIESVCVESAGKEMILHLVADNDNGTSTLFKMSMPIPPR